MKLSTLTRKLLVEVIVDKLSDAEPIATLENLIALSEIPKKAQIRRRSDPFGFALSIVQHCEAYGADNHVDALEALLSAIFENLGGWTTTDSERLSQTLGRASAVVASSRSLAGGQVDTDRRSFDIFISYNSRDHAQILDVVRWLREQRVRPWLDRDEIAAGSPFARDLDLALAQAPAAAVFAGPHGVGRWQDLEIRALLRQHVERGLRLLPVILPGALGEPAWPGFLRDLNQIDLRNGFSEGLQRLVG
jgi:hypothetical protein